MLAIYALSRSSIEEWLLLKPHLSTVMEIKINYVKINIDKLYIM